jgi:hypothetical protein
VLAEVRSLGFKISEAAELRNAMKRLELLTYGMFKFIYFSYIAIRASSMTPLNF